MLKTIVILKKRKSVAHLSTFCTRTHGFNMNGDNDVALKDALILGMFVKRESKERGG